MAWIESHQELARHPKTKRFARLIGVSLPAAVGHLHFFWWWAMDYAQDGDLSRYDEYDIADACGWDGDEKQIVNALIEAGFIDEEEDGLVIHDWFEYAGRLIEKREQNAERKRRSRAKMKVDSECHADVTRPSRGQTCDDQVGHGATVPNQTIPNHNDGWIDNAPAQETFEQAHKRVFGFACNPLQGEQLLSYLKDGMHEAVIVRAIERAGESGKSGYNFKFIRAIVENYFRSGVRTLDQAIKHDAAFDQSRRRDPPGIKSRQFSQIDMLNQLEKELENRDTG
ncbi:DnaD domain-containing protein [Paenibacillus sp. 32O-W]|uniref:DnaD domain-containing protein n=1 Tax=Paenibacillus sp. 32O-W TaxID=1695218 RepID=UPI00071FDEFD|nr:DnaD domain protein [Paenibacillus sp. 32O-W]ALS27166.1 DnaD domain-containing protein [Paenibacillus sp. 32O-W]